MKKFIQYIPFLLILSVSVMLFIKVNQDGNKAGQSLLSESQMVGKPIADMELENISPGASGDKIGPETFKNAKGEYTVINLFASWCTACLYEHKFVKTLKGSGINIIGVAWRDKREDALDWLEKNGNPYDKVAWDGQGKFGIMLGVTGIPETYLVGPDGVIVMHFARTITEDDIKVIKAKAKK